MLVTLQALSMGERFPPSPVCNFRRTNGTLSHYQLSPKGETTTVSSVAVQAALEIEPREQPCPDYHPPKQIVHYY